MMIEICEKKARYEIDPKNNNNNIGRKLNNIELLSH